MKYIRAKFTNYIGFYNGMGLYEMDIDFTRCQNKMILITGKNGSGKSTLMSSLNPFPDSSSSYIPNKDAKKELVLFHEGDTYNIQIYSPADANGKRKTTKAYIQKNGLELNENGNIQSYKDIIFSEFELDSNFISLSRMSSTDRGLGDKTPAERKKFVSNIIDNLEIYNDIYKTLNKKSLIYKSHVNTIHTKIQNIGNKDALENRLLNLTNREKQINSKILELNNNIVAIQVKNSLDEEDAKRYQNAIDEESKLKIELDLSSSQLDMYENKTKVYRNDIENVYGNNKILISTYRSKVEELTAIWKINYNRMNSLSEDILNLEAEISNSTIDSDISNRYKINNDNIKDLLKELSVYNVPDDSNLIIPITNFSIFCDKFDTMISDFYDGLSTDDIDIIINKHNKTYIDSIKNQRDDINNTIDNLQIESIRLQTELEILSVLDNRPKNCKIDSCPLIADAIKTKKALKYNPKEKIDEYDAKILELIGTKKELEDILAKLDSLAYKKMKLDNIIEHLYENIICIRLFYPELEDINNFYSMILNLNQFYKLREHKEVIDSLNLLKLLESERHNNELLKIEYDSYNNNIKLINSSNNRLKSLKAEQEPLLKETTDMKKEIDNLNSTIEKLSSIINKQSEYIEEYTKYNNILSDYNRAKSILDEYDKKSSKALEQLKDIEIFKSDIDRLNSELGPISSEISNIKGMLTMLDSYYREINEYKASYNTIECLKKYCNPTGGGIQTLFMQLYMTKTKELANQVLSMLFGGGYTILDFIINSNEFRIPFVGEGLPVDDISSGSGAQVSMMSMIINLVLLHQASTKFNIAQLDEVGANLDEYNNSQFTTVLFYCMDILNIDQLFMISHSAETDNTHADIIRLKGYDNYENSIQSGNIIWDYSKDAKF